jgi:hypothetical protein
MRSRVKFRFREADSALAAVAAAAAESDVGAGGRSMLEVVPPMSPRDEAIFLLHTAAEIEHALMVQYLYAAWSLPPDAPATVRRWRRDILQVAREEMAHFASVQNLLRFIGGPLNFDREDFPFRSDLYPFPLRLEPLGRSSLARYIAAEMPAEPDVDPEILTAMHALVSAGDGQPVNRVGALYNRLITLIKDERRLPDSLFRPETTTAFQALPSRYRADVGQGPLFLRVVQSRDEALSLLDDIARQGEGEDSILDSHFLTFVEIFDSWPAADRDGISLEVPTDANTTSAAVEGDDGGLAAGRITHPHARRWAAIFNHHYRMLLAWLQHALLTPSDAAASKGLSLRVFAEMLVLSDVGQLLATLPRTADGAGRAGAPFELPYSLAFPDLPSQRWDYQRDLVASARAQVQALGASAGATEDTARQRVLGAIEAAEHFLQAHSEPPPREATA